MNTVILIGRMTAKPEIEYTPNNTAVCKFNIAVDRNGNGADFPRITAFGKQAENLCKYVDKGRQVAIYGRIQTGSYKNRDGKTVYTEDIVANNIEYLSVGRSDNSDNEPRYAQIDDDLF